jgi:hypothetical protein
MGIALLFWIFIKLSQEYSATKTIQFSVLIPENKTLVSLPPDDMKIEMRGSGWDLLYDFFLAAQVELEYNLNDQISLSRSRNQLLSDIRNQLYSKGLEIRSLNYEGVQFQLDDKITKSVPVRLQADLKYAPGYQPEQIPTLEPDSVQISGPASLVDSLAFWRTDSVFFSDLSVDVDKQISLQKSQPSILIRPANVNLRVEVEQYTENTLFVPLQIVNAPDSILRIFPKNVSVNYIVGLSAFNNVFAEDFTILADFSNVDINNKNNNEVPVRLTKQPKSVRNVSINPKIARFFILKDSLNTENSEIR